MDPFEPSPTDWLKRLSAAVGATPAESVALAVLLLGGVACTGVLVWWSRTGPPQPVPAAAPAAPSPAAAAVTVHVAGAVARPGLVSLPAGSRVADAVAAAGGAWFDADLSQVNLARVLSDGERLVVPGPGPPAEPAAGASGAASGGATLPDGRLDLNAATESELESLPGIGPVLAEGGLAQGRAVSHPDSRPNRCPRDA